MNDIFEALEQFQQEIVEIYGSELVFKDINLKNTPAYTGVLASPEVFPQSLEYSAEFKESIEDTSKTHAKALALYTNNILQCLWNLADLCKKGYLRAIANQSAIMKALRYLDEEAFLPRVFNNKTYEAALALQKVLEIASSEQTLNIIPLESKRKGASEYLESLKSELKARITFYETHTPTVVNEKVKAIIRRNDLTRELIAKAGAWETNQKKIRQATDENLQILATPFDKALSPQDLTKLIKSCELLLEEGEAVNNQYSQYLTDWEKQLLLLPKEHSISDFINVLFSTKSTNAWLEQWQKLYWTSSMEVMPIGSQLARFHRGEMKAVARVNDALNLLRDQIVKLEQYQDERVQWQLFTQLLDEKVMQFADVAIPAFFSQYLENNALSYPLSTQPQAQDRLQENLGSLIHLIELIEHYQQQLIEHTMRLQEQSQQLDEANNLGLSETQQKREEYKIAVQEAKNKLAVRIEKSKQQLEQVKVMSSDAQKQKNIILEDLAKLSSKARVQQLRDAENRVRLAYNSCDEEGIALTRQTFIKDQFSTNYETVLDEAGKRFDPLIEEKQHSLSQAESELHRLDSEIKTLKQQIKKRKQDLKEGKAQLEHFLKCLTSDNGLYIPEKISESELLKLLECSDNNTVAFIKNIYKSQRQGNANWGFNTHNIRQYWTHYTTFLKTTDSEDDLFDLSRYIIERLEWIERELSTQSNKSIAETSLNQNNNDTMDDEETDSQATSVKEKLSLQSTLFLSQSNRWTMEEELQQRLRKREQTSELYHRILNEKQALLDKKEQMLKPHRQSKEHAEKNWLQKQYRHQLMVCDYNQNRIALDVLRLEFGLLEATETTQELLTLFERLKAKDPQEALNDFACIEDAHILAAIAATAQLTTPKSRHELSLHELSTSIPKAISRQKNEMEALQSLSNKAAPNVQLLDFQSQLSSELTNWQEKAERIVGRKNELALHLKEMVDFVRLLKLRHQIETALKTVTTEENSANPVLRMAELQKLITATHNLLNEIKSENVHFSTHTECLKVTLVSLEAQVRRYQTMHDSQRLAKQQARIENLLSTIQQEQIGVSDPAARIMELNAAIDEANALLELTKNNEDTEVIGQREKLSQSVTQLQPYLKNYEEENFKRPLIALSDICKDLTARFKQRPRPSHLYEEYEAFFANADYQCLILQANTKKEMAPVKKLLALISEMEIERTILTPDPSEPILPVSESPSTANEAKSLVNKSKPATQHSNKTNYSLERFDDYLVERSKSFYIKDRCSQLTYSFFSCVGYQTNAQLRTRYIYTLKNKYQLFQSQSSTTNYENLMDHIDMGIKQFSPRARKNEPGYELSLRAKLENFKEWLNKEVKPESESSAPMLS